MKKKRNKEINFFFQNLSRKLKTKTKNPQSLELSQAQIYPESTCVEGCRQHARCCESPEMM